MKKNKEYVFKQALDLVSEEGLKSLTIRDLAKKSDVSIGTIYNMFNTKEHLVLLLIDDYWHQAVHSMFEQINENQTILLQLETMYSQYLNISSRFHKDWIADVDGLSMASQEMRDLNAKYRNMVISKVSELLSNVLSTNNQDFNIDYLAEVIHIISINTDFTSETTKKNYHSLLEKIIF